MGDKSNIEWTDATWNPIVGCTIVSPGCSHCYAMAMAARINKMTLSSHYEGLTKKVNGNQVWTGKIAQAPDHILTAPLRWKKPRRIFVNSMGDLFHESIPDEWIDKVFAVMALAPQHTFQVLTKRAERMRTYMVSMSSRHTPDGNMSISPQTVLGVIGLDWVRCNGRRRSGEVTTDALLDLARVPWPLPNVWLGVSAERQQEADERIPHLLATPAALRFVSCEPLLGPIDLMMLRSGDKVFDALQGAWAWGKDDDLEHGGACAKLDWVIVGGESGPKARPMHPAWARSLRDQCNANGVPYFYKQWGEWLPSTELREPYQFARATVMPDGRVREDDPHHPLSRLTHPDMRVMCRVGKKAAGRLLHGVEHNAFPEVRSTGESHEARHRRSA